MIQFILATAVGLVKLMLLVLSIVMPLMLLLELSRTFGILEKATRLASPITRPLGFKTDSIFPLLAGIAFGISYGGGVLIGESRKGRITGNQAFLVAVFLALFHAIFEDTLLFVSQGAVWWIAVLSRLIVAVLITAAVAGFLNRSEHVRNRQNG